MNTARPDLERDSRLMEEAIALAESALGLTSPNPAVGCVIVAGDQIVGRGATATGGRPHAETVALAKAGARARGATAYVSLEPCAHFGQTPPCANALVDAGIRRVVIGCGDPFPKVRGKGIAILRKAGIAVTLGVMEEESRRINEGFFTRVEKGRPMVALKLAMTLDGRIATSSGDSKWISGEESRALVHRWRRYSDAVMVGAGTVIADDPRLTCREESGRDPYRVIIDAKLRSDPRARVFTQRSSASTILVTTPSKHRIAQERYGSAKTEVLAMKGVGGETALAPLFHEFGQRGWNRVMIEGGAHLAASALRQKVVDRIAIFVAPKILGGGLSAIEGLGFLKMKEAINLADLEVWQVGEDLLIEARVC
ncbi:MAG TPA: bifunctional diaminohydroxyphosphoribosylaminopyrimidine deaminase/5-amino-6-(5-phosphoribosylamino)uracil reductase RibD [Candidatus Binataceae bacterium]|nr:bifunctional diaminohydroxyphosphoribosylaminopyrimidine deaminase/5-amino-6-(5-phosphoribosylamino)uracil reductase RibD [Candidatus Binataceae bacterium]